MRWNWTTPEAAWIPLLLLTAPLAAQTPALEEIPLNRISLVEPGGDEFGASDLASFEKDLERDLTPEERSAYETGPDAPWRTYEDEVIRFDYPDLPQIEVKVVKREPLRVVGGVVSSVDRQYDRAYRLTVGKAQLPYGVILVKTVDWLDDGICWCGPIVYKKLIHADGNLLEFSLLPSGAIKKVQVLGARQRAMLFEWTHSVLREDVYSKLARSIRLKDKSGLTLAEWQELAKEKGGWEAGKGWLERGMAEKDFVALLGEPARREQGNPVFVHETRPEDREGWRTTLTLALKDGRFNQLGGESWEQLAPPKGSLAWAEYVLRQEDRRRDEPPSPIEGEEEVAFTDEAAALMFTNFLEAAPTADPGPWGRWCGVVRDLADLGRKDARVKPVIQARMTDFTLEHSSTPWLMEIYDLPGREGWGENRLRNILSLSVMPDGELPFESELHNLTADLEPGPVAGELLGKMFQCPSAEVRGIAVYFAEKLPPAQNRAMLLKGLLDPDPEVRRRAAYCGTDVYTKADLPLLKERLEKETDETVRGELEEVMGGLK